MDNTQRDVLIRLLSKTGMLESESRCRIVADELIANGVIILPCKVGDTVYLILSVQNRILEFTVQEIRLTSRFLQLVFAEGSTYSIWDYRFDLHFGKTVFLNREEAERALKEREQDDGRKHS